MIDDGLWHYGTMALWLYGSMALWLYGSMTLWLCTTHLYPLQTLA